MTSILIAAAISGIVSGTQGAHSQNPSFQAELSSSAAQPLDDATKGKHACKGQNGCKGQGGCKS